MSMRIDLLVFSSVAAMSCSCRSAAIRPWVIPEEQTVRRPDGSEIYWSLDRQRALPTQGVLVLAQGSGCAPATENPNIARAKALLPDFAVVTVEKYGVLPHEQPKDPYLGCSRTFYAHHTVSQRVADYKAILKHLRASGSWDGRLVLFGGSEGGAAMALLAPEVDPSAVVIFSTTPGRSFRQTFKMSVPPQVAAEADAEFQRIEAEPLSARLWGGNSYRWWADILDRDLTAALLTVRAPILLVYGERDGPVQVTRVVRDDFVRAGHCNLTCFEMAGLDHEMRDVSGVSHLDEVLERMSAWLWVRVMPSFANPVMCSSTG